MGGYCIWQKMLLVPFSCLVASMPNSLILIWCQYNTITINRHVFRYNTTVRGQGEYLILPFNIQLGHDSRCTRHSVDVTVRIITWSRMRAEQTCSFQQFCLLWSCVSRQHSCSQEEFIHSAVVTQLSVSLFVFTSLAVLLLPLDPSSVQMYVSMFLYI